MLDLWETWPFCEKLQRQGEARREEPQRRTRRRVDTEKQQPGNGQWSDSGHLEIKVCGGTLKVSGFVEDVPCQFIVDAGADVTILSSRLFHKLDSAGRLKNASNERVVKGLDGQVIPIIGQAVLEIIIEETSSKLEVWVASIQEECILGGDFLRSEGCVIDYPGQTLGVGDAEIPLVMGGEEFKCLRVILDKAVRVPLFTEMVIPAKVERGRRSFRWVQLDHRVKLEEVVILLLGLLLST